MKLLNKLFVALVLLILNLCFAPNAIAANPDHVSKVLSTNVCQACDLSNVDLTAANLKSADLSNANLHAAALSKAILKSANLGNANLQEAKLYQADLSNAILKSANLQNAILIDAVLSNADLTASNLEEANLLGARFIGFAGKANLASANLRNSNLRGSILNTIDLTSANLSNADISGDASLQGAILNNADLRGAKLSDANLVNATLIGAVLNEADLRNVNLKKANLTGANLTGANLEGLKLDHAILTDAVGLDPYGDSLLQKAMSTNEKEQFLDAIAILQHVPAQTRAYSQAQTLIAEYTKKQEVKEQNQHDLDAAKQVQVAVDAAESGNYKRAMALLKKVPENTSSYQVAQANLAAYEEKQRLNEQMEQKRRDAEHAEIQAQIASRSSLADTDSANNLKTIDSRRFGSVYPIQKYASTLSTLSDRCSSSPAHIADMSALATNQLFQIGKKFDNMSFLQQALDATELGLLGQSCESIFASLEILIASES